MHFGGHQSLCLLKCLRSKNTFNKTRKVFKFLKLTAKPKVLVILKRSWKKSWNLKSEFEKHTNPVLMACASSSAIDGLMPNLPANIKRRDASYSRNLTTISSDRVTLVTYKFVS